MSKKREEFLESVIEELTEQFRLRVRTDALGREKIEGALCWGGDEPETPNAIAYFKEKSDDPK